MSFKCIGVRGGGGGCRDDANIVKNGFFGAGSVVLPFSKMNTTDDMSGLSLGLSCTHKRPKWMQSKASSATQTSKTEIQRLASGGGSTKLLCVDELPHVNQTPRGVSRGAAAQEQLRLHSAAHSSKLLLSTRTNLSGAFISGNAKNPSPSAPHLSGSLLRHPCENLPLLQSTPLVGSKPSRHLHIWTAPSVWSQ
ncbi:hypothetical protein EJB05_43863 [Eragrostis curvula]|uniref:Uncharacterized protein n=1 Tax=Eragrostis curvula TaxID=38414 RepID=A0A5J9TG75_9POAL|nr:hypothetical protein EJB05_43863 [Eragrostis curvula]